MTAACEESVRKIIATHINRAADDIADEATLADLGIASLEAIEILFDIEEHFDITLPERDPNFDTGTVRGLIEIVAAATADGDPAVNG